MVHQQATRLCEDALHVPSRGDRSGVKSKARRSWGIAGFVVATVALSSFAFGGTTGRRMDARQPISRLPAAIVDLFAAEPDAAGARSGRAEHSTSTLRIRWKRSRAVGTPWAGALINGVRLPAEGQHFFTWDFVRNTSPNRAWRRFGTDRLIRILLTVLSDHARAHPDAPRVAIGDLSRPRGGDFGKRFGGLGHSSHQNGLDVDIYYPRKDRLERAPRFASQIDRVLAQDLVDRFVRAGAQFVFVGPNTGLSGPPRIVQPLVYHDDHMHVRIAAR